MACSAELLAGRAVRPDGIVVGAPAVALSDVAVRYPGQPQPALEIARWVVAPGERIAVIGPSGSGKTTLLRLLLGSLRPERGAVDILGVPARGRRSRAERRRTGMVFQSFALIERATVAQNVLYGRLGHVDPLASLLGWFGAADRQLAYEAACEVGLEGKLHARVDELSGGQRQRVAIARVLAQQPALILADEPVNNLDPRLAEEIIALLADASHRRGATLIMSLHQPTLARAHAERIVGIGNGRIQLDQPTAEVTDALLGQLYGHSLAAALGQPSA
jgi:phosphonate transport system ATP-binding protein